MKAKMHGHNFFAIVSFLVVFLTGCGENVTVLHPQGPVARSEYYLILWSFFIMSIVVLIVFVLYGFVIVRYRERPENMDYEPPETKANKKLEIAWTVAPVVMVVALAIPMAKTTFGLENPPVHPAGVKPMTIYVTSADWKWLFKYPEQGIETVNYVNIPANTPINFELTAVSAMNSFWVPALGGQEYAMPGQRLKLWLQADRPGTYAGRSANFSGKGFTHMTFDVVAQTPQDFTRWVHDVKTTAPKLTDDQYKKILEPGLVDKMTFSSTDPAKIMQEETAGGLSGNSGQHEMPPVMPNTSSTPNHK
ncbi:cytochrome aa3 quinol oxidase subunit II [Aneurinibacillus terranovensis]|uniref:cytochrome aa3 quinol oxidase subunit II n=1 Tax=Aneurinibacillus terranovensis TaxID=278991 RepID=UPI000684721A